MQPHFVCLIFCIAAFTFEDDTSPRYNNKQEMLFSSSDWCLLFLSKSLLAESHLTNKFSGLKHADVSSSTVYDLWPARSLDKNGAYEIRGK